jgi:hypothetical protein
LEALETVSNRATESNRRRLRAGGGSSLKTVRRQAPDIRA